MRKYAVFIVLVLLLALTLLTGCMAPHANAQGEPSGNMIIQDKGGHEQNAMEVVTLKPMPTPTSLPSAEPVPAVVSTPSPTPVSIPDTPEPAVSGLSNPQNIPELSSGVEGVKYAYLTFDDGPSKNTEAILAVLEEKEAVATFFVIGDNAARYPEKIKAIAAQGSLVANHTQTHKTDEIYVNAETFLKDLNAGRETIRSILGQDYTDDLIRFPYGSTNRRCRDYRGDVREAGYRYFDWNALNGDAESNASKRSADDLYDQLVETVDVQANRGRDLIILMHDTNSKEKTVAMLDDAIDYIRSLGYTFATLENVPME